MVETSQPDWAMMMEEAMADAGWEALMIEQMGEEAFRRVVRDPVAMAALVAFSAIAHSGNEDEFTPRKEANVLIAAAVRNGPFKDAHAAGRLLDRDVREIMVSASRSYCVY